MSSLQATGAIFPPVRSSPISADCAVSLMNSMGHVEPSSRWVADSTAPSLSWLCVISSHPHSFSMRRNLDIWKGSQYRLHSLLLAGRGGWSQFQSNPAVYQPSSRRRSVARETLCRPAIQERGYLPTLEYRVEHIDSHNCWSNSLLESQRPHQFCHKNPAKQVNSTTNSSRWCALAYRDLRFMFAGRMMWPQ